MPTAVPGFIATRNAINVCSSATKGTYMYMYTEGESGSPSAEDLGDLELSNGLEFENEHFHHSHENLSALQGKRGRGGGEEGSNYQQQRREATISSNNPLLHPRETLTSKMSLVKIPSIL